MKRIMLFLAGIITVAAFAPQASALPVFARQTGMACSACHFQHFPMLNGFGRAFKSSAFTMIGAQGKVDGEGLSIPNTLNMAALITAGYEKSNMKAEDTPKIALNTGNGQFYVPGNGGELSLFVGGRVTDNAGFLTEIGTTYPAGMSAAKLPILFEVTEGTRAGLVLFTTGLGVSYGFETLNTGANSVHLMSGVGGMADSHSTTLSAQQYIGTGTGATGLAFVGNNANGFINLTKFNQIAPDSGFGVAAELGSTYVRLVGNFDVADWDTGVGVQSWSGDSTDGFALSTTKATAIDGQIQGELGGMPVGFYFSYAKAPVVAALIGGTTGNTYNMDGVFDKSSFNISGEIGVIPAKATLGAAIRRGKSGVDDGDGANATDNAVMLTATYKLAQNMILSLSYTSASGSYWDQINPDIAVNPIGYTYRQIIGSKTTTLSLFTLF